MCSFFISLAGRAYAVEKLRGGGQQDTGGKDIVPHNTILLCLIKQYRRQTVTAFCFMQVKTIPKQPPTNLTVRTYAYAHTVGLYEHTGTKFLGSKMNTNTKIEIQ